jgi:ABC-type oligopeptide transport system substrate-binding subunit
VQIPSEPSHLNPYLAETGAEMTVLRHLVRAPLRFGLGNVPEGDAAESYAWEDKGLRLRLRFRKDISWSDGAPLTACQYREGVLRMLGKGTGLPSPLSELYASLVGYSAALGGNFAEIGRAVECDAMDLTLKTTKAHDRLLLNALAFLGSAPWREGLDPEQKVTSGTFRVVEWKKGRSIKIAARDPHRFLAPNFEFLFVRDADTALIMYEKGDLEILSELPSALLPKLRSRPDFHRTTMMATYYVAFSPGSGAWVRDVRFRKALALSAGREEIPSLLQGGERAAYTITSDDLLPTKTLDAFRERHRENVAEAKRLWAEASARTTAPKRIRLGYSAGSRHQMLMERLANNWKRHLGVEVDFEPSEWNHYIAVLKKQPPEVFRYAWTAVYPDPRFFLGLFSSSSPNNFGRWRSEVFDAQLKGLDAQTGFDEKFFDDVFAAEETLVWNEAALIPLYHYSKLYMARGELGRKLKFTYQGFLDLTQLTKAE